MEEWTQLTERSTADGYEVFHTDCPARTVLDHVTSRWGVWVLLALRQNDLRFHELRASIEGISEKMLSQTLRTLVRDGLVWRAVAPSTPPQVTYGLTPLGRGTSTPLAGLFAWIRDHATDIQAVQAEFDQGSVAAPSSTDVTARRSQPPGVHHGSGRKPQLALPKSATRPDENRNSPGGGVR